jgi:protein tyrosine phosphatase
MDNKLPMSEKTFFNFRDASKFNKYLKENIVYRSSALCLVDEENKIIETLNKKGVSTIIDLRADRELKEHNYSQTIKNSFQVVHAPFDPWTQSLGFQSMYNTGTNAEIAYLFFTIECKLSIKTVVETILTNPNSTVIHCHAGKDRTGIIFTLFHLLSGADKEIILLDYLASEMDTDKKLIQILLCNIEVIGGIEQYLLSCDLTNNQIYKLKEKLCK